jgi:flagellar protein FliS
MRTGVATSAYGKFNANAAINEKSPEEITMLLLERACAAIKGCVLCIDALDSDEMGWEEKIPRVEKFHSDASKAMQIITALKETLDHKRGGQLAEQLETTYSASLVSLMKATKNRDKVDLEKIQGAVGELRDAWIYVINHSPQTKEASA